MSILEKFFKIQKGGFVEQNDKQHPLEKPLAHDNVYEYHHKNLFWKTEDCTIRNQRKRFLRTK